MGGSLKGVGVEGKTAMVGGMVGTGKGLIEESGLRNMIPTTTITMAVAVKNRTDSTSQMDTFKLHSVYREYIQD